MGGPSENLNTRLPTLDQMLLSPIPSASVENREDTAGEVS